MIAPADIERLAVEIMADVAPQQWLEREGIAAEALAGLAAAVNENFFSRFDTAVFVYSTPEEDAITPPELLTNFMLQSFRLGWEAHRQYGRREPR